ncbi:MAG TPA: KGG domain-containing protein [Flavisolibacter sp.]|jgi:general stress protein YciG|nr:KGG domain-containing protein [Flavisolibacter sp.]
MESSSNNQQQGATRARRGFAAMDREKQKQIASQGGRAAHQLGVAHRWTSAEASEAGRKGGQHSRGSRSPAEEGSGRP